MKTAMSAGGVIVSLIHNQWFVLILKDMNDTWTFPKGLIEEGERPVVAATREIKEEVAITNLILLAPLPSIHYVYKRHGTIKKTVYYFIFQSTVRTRPKVQKEEGIQEAQWVTIDKAIDMIGYRETNVTLLEEAWNLLQLRTYKN